MEISKKDGAFSRFLSNVLLLSALCLSLVSVLSSFMTVHYLFIIPGVGDPPILRTFEVTYWSYKAISRNEIVTEALFADYWLGNKDTLTVLSGINWVFILIFVSQVATLTSGFVSLLKIQKLRIIPFVSSLVTIALMVYAYVQTSQLTYSLGTYELGYWFTYPSTFLFLLSFILSLDIKRNTGKNIKHTPTPTLTQ